jgi:hypothetical protein
MRYHPTSPCCHVRLIRGHSRYHEIWNSFHVVDKQRVPTELCVADKWEMQLNLIKTCTVYIPVFKKYSSFVLLIMLIRDFQIFSQIDAQICVFRQVDNVCRSGLRLKILQNKNFVRIISCRHLFKCCFYIMPVILGS